MEVALSPLLAAPAFDLPWQVVAGIMIFTTALIVSTRRKAARSAGFGGSAARRQRARADAGRSRQDKLSDIIMQMETLAREAVAQMDTRYHKLEAVIRDADRRIAELRALSAATPGAAPESDHASSAGGLDVVVDEDVLPTPPLRHPAAQAQAGKPDRAEIYRLADCGCGVDEIARRLTCLRGEVELILSLRTGAANRPSPVR